MRGKLQNHPGDWDCPDSRGASRKRERLVSGRELTRYRALHAPPFLSRLVSG